MLLFDFALPVPWFVDLATQLKNIGIFQKIFRLPVLFEESA